MQQKTIWMRYLIIGISLMSLFSVSRCKTNPVEPTILTSNFVYINNTTESIDMSIYDRDLSFYREELVFSIFKIQSKDSVKFQMKGEGEGIFPFYLPDVGSISGDSAVISNGDKCIINYTKFKGIRDGNGVFHLANYDNYSTELINEPNPTFYYTFDTEDFDKASNCE